MGCMAHNNWRMAEYLWSIFNVITYFIASHFFELLSRDIFANKQTVGR